MTAPVAAGAGAPRLRTALRASLSALADDVARFLLVGVAWVVAFGVVFYGVATAPGGSRQRGGAGAARRRHRPHGAPCGALGEPATLRDFLDGMAHRPRSAWPLALGAAAICAIGSANVLIALLRGAKRVGRHVGGGLRAGDGRPMAAVMACLLFDPARVRTTRPPPCCARRR